MKEDIIREDSESTQRKAWSAAEAAAFPALGIHPAKRPAALARVPRASVVPPSSETVVTPAPVFDQTGQPVEDLDGIVELSSSMLEDAADTGLHKIEMLSEDLVEEVVEEAEVLHESEAIEEVDSNLLAFVEARGEISEKHHAVPVPSEVSKVSLASLHETLHSQAVANGVATYSTGVPIHDLESGTSASRTLPIRRPNAEGNGALIKNLLIGGVFLAGIGAGVYFGMPSKQAPKSTAVPAAAPAVLIPEEPAEAAMASAVQEEPSQPTVAPLVEEDSPDAEGTEAAAAAAAESEGIQVQPLDAVDAPADETAMATESDIVVRPLEVDSEPSANEESNDVQRIVAPRDRKASRRARVSDGDEKSSGTLGTSTTGDPGVLMLAAKPPCDILIDGKNTGLKTPQRVLRLPPGKHKVTLINEEHDLRDSFRVSIQSGKKTRIVRDMTSKLK